MMTPEKYSAEEWEHLRQRFSNSILNDTEIAILGQNASISWPFKGSDETPTKYIEYDFEELKSVPGLIGKKKRVQNLMDILRETLAFDDPFSDMMDQVEAENEVDDAFDRILERLEISKDYPVEFIHFSDETTALLKSEGIETLIQAIHYGQNLDRSIAVCGDLKSFLNGLAHTDETSIMKHIPFRITERGLHLAEAVCLIARDLDGPIQIELLGQAGVSLTEEEEALRQRVNQLDLDGSLKVAMTRFDALCEWFSKEAADLKQVCATNGSIERYFIPVNDARRERIAGILTRAKFGIPASERVGFLGKLSGLFSR